MKKITEEQFYDLLTSKLSGDITAEELALLQQQLLLDRQWELLYNKITIAPPASNDKAHTQQAYEKHIVKMKRHGKLNELAEQNEAFHDAKSSHIISLYRKLTYASLIAAAIIGFVFFVIRPFNRSSALTKNIVTQKGVRSHVTLPDGTQVWLNADSKLFYANNLKGATREVSLVGEAYFDVVHDAAHPFIIHTGKADVRVLGTAFNIRNYPTDKSLETTLMRGKIEVSFTDRPGEKIILKPFEKLIINKSHGNTLADHNGMPAGQVNAVVVTSVTYAADNEVAETSWMNDKMIFTNRSLESIAEELERRFAITIVFKNPKVQEFRYTGTFDNEPLDKILRYIQLSKNIDYKVEGKIVTIQ